MSHHDHRLALVEAEFLLTVCHRSLSRVCHIKLSSLLYPIEHYEVILVPMQDAGQWKSFFSFTYNLFNSLAPASPPLYFERVELKR